MLPILCTSNKYQKKYFELAIAIFEFTILVFSCQQNAKSENPEHFKITVFANDFPDSIKVKLYNRDIDKNIDSAYVINERFELSGKVDIPSLCYLNFYDKEGKEIRPYTYFYLGNEIIQVEGDYSDFMNAEVIGSAQTDLLKKYKNIARRLREEKKREIALLSDTVKIESLEKGHKREIWNQETKFLFENANNQMSIHQIIYRQKEISKDSLKLFYDRLDSVNANSIQGKELHDYAVSIDIKIGDKFRDIAGIGLDGKEYKVSDFIGKIILLDFWSSGCAPCRLQNRNEFQQLHRKFGADDLVIISYSLDTQRQSWANSSIKDSIQWVNISDLRGLKSDNVKLYAVNALPNSFLIDKNGTIANIFLGYEQGANIIAPEIKKLL